MTLQPATRLFVHMPIRTFMFYPSSFQNHCTTNYLLCKFPIQAFCFHCIHLSKPAKSLVKGCFFGNASGYISFEVKGFICHTNMTEFKGNCFSVTRHQVCVRIFGNAIGFCIFES